MVIAAGALLVVSIVGLVTGDEKEPRGDDVALNQPSETSTPTATPSETAPAPDTNTPVADEDAIAFTEGIELEVIASQADCWIQAVSDGGQPVQQTLQVGDSVTFNAEKELYVRLGFPEGVELVVNGHNIGSPKGVDPINLTFPDDIDLFL